MPKGPLVREVLYFSPPMCYTVFKRGGMMSKRKKVQEKPYSGVMDSPIGILIMALLAIPLGIWFIAEQTTNTPIPRAEAVAHIGCFESYETGKNYCGINFLDGSYYNVYPHTESAAFRKTMETLPRGTKLYLLVNPNNDYVAEIKTETEELMNFELSQQAIASYDDGYVGIGIILLVAGLLLIVYAVFFIRFRKKEATRRAIKQAEEATKHLRYADETVKSRTLLTASVAGYRITYRRVKNVNELVVNGRVYDEMKGFLEFEHNLCATVDGHVIEAGYDADSYSYIRFDDETIEQKKRRW